MYSTATVASIRPISGLSYQDRQFVQKFQRKNFRFQSAPDWVYDDKEVRRVVAAQVALLARVQTIHEDIWMLRLLNRRAIKLLKKSTSREWHSLARAAQRKGLPAYLASIIYKTYRLGWDSVQCAQDLGVSPAVIRQALHRLKHTQRRLEGSRIRYLWRERRPKVAKPCECGCGELAKRGHRFIYTHHTRTHQLDVNKAAKFRAMGLPWAEVARRVGYRSKCTAQRAVKRAGLFVPSKSAK